MIIDRSSSVASSGRLNQERTAKRQQEANAESPLPVLQYLQENQMQSDHLAGNSQIPKDMLRNFATHGFRKLNGSQQNGVLLEESDGPKSEHRKHSEQIQITKSITGPPALRQYTMGSAKREAASYQAGFYTAEKQTSQRLITLRPTEVQRDGPKHAFTAGQQPPSRSSSLEGHTDQALPDVRMSNGS